MTMRTAIVAVGAPGQGLGVASTRRWPREGAVRTAGTFYRISVCFNWPEPDSGTPRLSAYLLRRQTCSIDADSHGEFPDHGKSTAQDSLPVYKSALNLCSPSDKCKSHSPGSQR